MKHTKDNGVIPNYTCNGFGVTKEVAKRTAELCGAVAVSHYGDDQCFNAVEQFVNAGMDQVNIHYMLAKETLNALQDLIDDIVNDPRLKGLNAVVLLQYKPHGRGIGKFHSISIDDYKKILNYAELRNVSLGFDSCSAPMYFKAVEDDVDYNNKTMYAEPCESGLFSFYMNVRGEYFPCSFAEGEGDWKEGIPYQESSRFMGVWYHPRIVEWREKLINSSKSCDCKSVSICRSCPLYTEVSNCKLIQLEVLE